MDRRNFLGTLLGSLAAVLAVAGVAGADSTTRRRRRRRVHRRVRRRHRRRVVFRTLRGRRVWVVPTAMVVGWELADAHRVVVVQEIKVVESDGEKTEVAVVADAGGKANGKTEEVPVLREDTDENTKEMKGTELPDDDTTTPAVESEEEVEEREHESKPAPEDRPNSTSKSTSNSASESAK